MEFFNLYQDDLDMLFMNLELYFRRKLTPRQTKDEEARSLVIFDEVQFCPRARAAIKHLVADRRYDYIETGSLISIKKNVKDIMLPSEEHAIEMFPMDFEEFLWAMGDESSYGGFPPPGNGLFPAIPDCRGYAAGCRQICGNPGF